MKYRVLHYTLKVWLSSVVLTPLIQIAVQLITQVPYKFNSVRDIAVYFVYMLVCGWLFSIPCWFLLWLSTWLSNLLTSNTRLIKTIITGAGILIAILPFVTYAGKSLPQYDSTDFIWVMLYPLTIVTGIWVFRLKPIVQPASAHDIDESIANTDGPIDA
ncbi:hypothetical protein [Mucilaginibacter polytrichastri]|uniref:Uncharacterized protein n=1 Tax=Mucilaginibacter polytrichastri TaxID=1302689 RepID=A0A1Q6A5R4_9SPHI|nr:hypothetical protein [Mucilaginibacter polytrichastri]OKS89360.1 hypothetical protein RG47T_4844 [Mucilaginibacter polytrichastri]SFS73918.1 hypothetical protein SAMN04487890_103247 [Mucilaginibacter polytrichastri]